MKFQPLSIPLDAAPGLRTWLAAMMRAIADALAEPSVSTLHLEVRSVEPTRRADGDIVYADGTLWNPGGGAGIYARISGAWVKL